MPFISKGEHIRTGKIGGHTLSTTEDRKSLKLESLVESIRKQQTNEATAAFTELVVALCDEPETDKTLKQLVNH